MLDLLGSFSGSPSHPPVSLVLQGSTSIIYPSGDSVVLLDARSLLINRTLAFRDAFSWSDSSVGTITAFSVDINAKRIVAATDNKVAIWCLSALDKATWRIHSSLVASHPVTCIDLTSDRLALGGPKCMSVYRVVPDGDLPAWNELWSVELPTPSQILFSPALGYIASASPFEPAVRIYAVATHHLIQKVRHPYPVVSLKWRIPPTKYPDDLCLYTKTGDSVLRVFMPVIDDPHRLQLHTSFDRYSFVHDYLDSDPEDSDILALSWLDREIMNSALIALDSNPMDPSTSDLEQGRRRRIRQVIEEGWDMFALLGTDGSLTVRALANIDRRPPTLLRQFTIIQFPPHSLHPSNQLYLLPPPKNSLETPFFLTTSPLRTYSISPLPFFENTADGLQKLARGNDTIIPYGEKRIDGFVRTPEGAAVASMREGGGGEIYVLDQRGNLHLNGLWDGQGQAALFDRGKGIAIHKNDTLTIHLYKQSDLLQSTYTLDIPHSPPSTPQIIALPSDSLCVLILSITPTSISSFHVTTSSSPPRIELQTTQTLPLPRPPTIIMSVDPMAWAHKPARSASMTLSVSSLAFPDPDHPGDRDSLASISDDGTLTFWSLGASEASGSGWRSTGSVDTGRQGIRMARCSSAKKTALISVLNAAEELSIWDSKESEFSSGLEYSHVFEEPVNDLDWTSTDNGQSILAVGFVHRVVLLCQQRMTYFDREPAWGILGQLDLSQITPYSISDSIWLAGGSLIVGAGHQILHYGSPRVSSTAKHTKENASLFERVAWHNGPLDDYHPQMLLQCLLWDKVELVKDIIIRLSSALDIASYDSAELHITWKPLDIGQYTTETQAPKLVNGRNQTQYSYLFDGSDGSGDSQNTGFTRDLVSGIVRRLERHRLSHLSANEQAHLIVLIQATLQIDEQRRALDANGLRYLISIRSFYLINELPIKPALVTTSSGQDTLGRRHRIRYRDILWAFFSQSQEILLTASTEACGGKMTWKDARALGVFLWLESVESLKAQAEVIARNQYMAGDDRDPTACCLLYFALGKVRLVYGLWKQAAWHPEQQVMLKFLSNDFDNPRWRTAALKNAFALLSKQRYEYAAAFFLLGRSLKDAVNVCLKQLKDFQLAVAICRIVENGDDGPILREVLSKTVIPTAFEDANRWLACWAFWKLHRRDLSVRILLTPLRDIASGLDIRIQEIGTAQYDDPSLALLFSQLKGKSLQTVKGSSEISGRTEFNFVLQIARVFCRMGCHALALDLVAHWSFDRVTPDRIASPPAVEKNGYDHSLDEPPSSPPVTRRSHFGSMRRRASLVIDMEIPITRPTSPTPVHVLTPVKDTAESERSGGGEGAAAAEIQARQTGLGNLMRSAKRDVQVPEFNMDAFF